MKTIILVEDEKMVREGLRDVLEREGFIVYEAQDGLEAMQLLTTVKPDLLVTDIIMPDSDGFELLFSLKDSGHTFPVLVMSGGGRIGSNDYLKMVQVIGYKQVLHKPFSISEFLEKINIMIGS